MHAYSENSIENVICQTNNSWAQSLRASVHSKWVRGYSPQKNGGFQQADVEEAPWCPCNGGIQDHQHILLWFCHPFHPASIFLQLVIPLANLS